MRRSSRELSSRVSIHVHRQPNRQRRLAWWLALSVGVGSLLWLSGQYLQRQHRLYQAGDVAMTHRMFENECWRCHTTWAPLERLLSFRDAFPSTTNEQCETCHKVAEHQPEQKLAHGGIPCAACHKEHKGAETLARPHDRFCVSCHADLKEHGGQHAFANNITRFDVPGGHPEFLLTQLLKGEAPPTQGAEIREEHAVAKFQRSGEDDEPRWQDRGRIRFNHAKHLYARYDHQKLVDGLTDENRQPVDLSDKCESCHQPDADHRYFQPIQFEAHCCKCHPLLFDPVRYPRQSVPHELPEIIRGFLTETYTLRELQGATQTAANPTQQFCPSFPQQLPAAPDTGTDDEVDQPRRPLPGHRDQQKLTQAQAQKVLTNVVDAEKIARDHQHRLFDYEATGGCRYCHEVEVVEPQSKTSLSDWKIVPTQIPARWLPHSEFHHEPHRLLDCGVCHVGVAVSENTGDVLIPSRAVCVACHSSQPKQWASAWKEWFRSKQEWVQEREAVLAKKRQKSNSNPVASKQTQSFGDLITRADRGTRTDCIECHSYHNPTKDKWNGPFVPEIK